MPIFHYDDYTNPYGPSIAQALQHQGDIQAAGALQAGDLQAEALRQQGALRAQLFGTVGNALTAIPQQVRATREADLRDQALRQQTQLSGMTLQDKIDQRNAEQQIGQIVAGASRGPDGTYDVPAILAKLPPETVKYAQPYIERMATFNTAQEHQTATRVGAVQTGAAAALQNGAPPDVALRLVNTAEQYGVAPADQAAAWRQQLADDPTQAPSILKSLVGYQKPITVKTDERLVSPATLQTVVPAEGEPGKGDYTINGQRFHADGTPVGAAVPPQAPGRTPEQVSLDLARIDEIKAKLSGTVPLTPAEQAKLEVEWATLREKQTQDNAAPALSGDALDMVARQYAMTGQLPPMGMGTAGAKVRTAIINKAADTYKNLDLPSQQAAYRANQQSLTKLQGTTDKVSAFESTAGKNLDQFLALADKIPDTGVPWLNLPARMLTRDLVGDANMAAATAARDVALREIARVTNDPNLSGVLSDSARQEVSALSPQNATFAQIKAVAKVLRQDMANVHGSLNDQITDIQKRIATPPGGTTTPAGGVRILSITPVQ